MAITFPWNLQHLWPFSTTKFDELKSSKQLVNKLNIPDQTKQFVFALRDPNTQSIIYILSSVDLSEQSSVDANSLINEIKPDAVIVQAGSLFHFDEEDENEVPTSAFGVIKCCFVDKIGRDKYESVAADFVLKQIFGTGFNGPLLAAKKAAENVSSSFIVVRFPLGNSYESNNENDSKNNNNSTGFDAENRFSSIVNSLFPRQHGAASLASIGMKRFSLNKDVRMVLAEDLSGHVDPVLIGDSKNYSVSEGGLVEIQPTDSYNTPAFAEDIYPLLEQLNDMFSEWCRDAIFSDLPSTANALAHAQKMLLDVNRGEVLDNKSVSEVYTFRIAVEGIRTILNNEGMQPIGEKDVSTSNKIEFSELPDDDKSEVLFAQAIRSQTDKFKTIVAVVDASTLAGIRKHWDTPLPSEAKDIVGELIMDSDGKGVGLNHGDMNRLLSDRPAVAVGAGATAVLGVSSLTKVVTFKIPASLKIVLSQMQKLLSVAVGSSKVVAPGFATSRVVTRSVIASAENTSVSAMTTSFYEIMRKRKMQRVGFLPWTTFAASVGTCTGLFLYGDGIECAIESLPSARSIASLGRGIQNLREASQTVMQTEGTRLQKSIESLVNRLRGARGQ
ncbi:uncharacterized protein LOC123914847 [Trifolium pratense]|uniref:uncharacterized protein LOC123914847 n=1 Tax=Trifolium pratense TaxID=57577 RepID=UPI001E6910D2|nr:uncharacterized protein LOC123914847 [Trifolium pratense]